MTALPELSVWFTGTADCAGVPLVDHRGGIRLQRESVTCVHSFVARVGRGRVVRERRVATVTDDVTGSREGRGFGPCRGSRGHNDLRFPHRRIITGVMTMSPCHFEIITDVDLETVQFSNGVVQRLLCVAEGAGASPGGGGAGRDNQAQRGGGRAPGGHSSNPV